MSDSDFQEEDSFVSQNDESNKTPPDEQESADYFENLAQNIKDMLFNKS